MTQNYETTAAELRAKTSPVSERFEAMKLEEGAVIYDSTDHQRWIQSDSAIERTAMR